MEETNTSEGQTQEPEMVTIPEAEMEDLEAFIAADDSLEADGEEADLVEEPTETKPKASAEPKKEEKPEPTKEELAAQLKAETEKHEKLKAHAKQVELWNARQATEIGELRKNLRAAITEKEKNLDEKLIENPREGNKLLREIEKHEEDLNILDQHEAALNFRNNSYQTVVKHIPEEELDVEGMVKVLESDNLDKGFLTRFAKDPFAEAAGDTLIQLQKRVIAEKRVVEAVNVIKQLMAKLDKANKGKRDVLSGVERAARQMPSVTASNGGAVPSSRGSIANVSDMSDEALAELLK